LKNVVYKKKKIDVQEKRGGGSCPLVPVADPMRNLVKLDIFSILFLSLQLFPLVNRK
jgi:hypothetical protein